MDAAELRSRVEALAPWFHSIDLGQGIRTDRAPAFGGGNEYPASLWERIAPFVPASLAGARVLDIGCNGGFFAAEAKRAGAAYVLGIESNPRYAAQARLVSAALGLDFEVRDIDVYDLGGSPGCFDLVFMLGVVYHLKNPILALEKVAAVTRGTVIVESAIIPDSDRPAPESRRFGGQLHELRFVEVPAGRPENQSNWFVPSFGCLQAFLRSAGFTEIVAARSYRERAVVVARKKA